MDRGAGRWAVRSLFLKNQNLRRPAPHIDRDDHDPGGTIVTQSDGGAFESSQTPSIDPAFTRRSGRRGLDFDNDPFMASVIGRNEVDLHARNSAVSSHDAEPTFDEMDGCKVFSMPTNLGQGQVFPRSMVLGVVRRSTTVARHRASDPIKEAGPSNPWNPSNPSNPLSLWSPLDQSILSVSVVVFHHGKLTVSWA